VTPVLKEQTDELPTIAPVKPAAPLVSETSAPKPVLFNIPSPTGFLKQLGHTPKPKVEILSAPIAPISPPIAPPIAPPISQDQEDGESTMRMQAVERPSEPPAEAAPRFSANRTQVMSADEFETIDVAGWLVPIPAGTPTIVLEPGCAIGTNGGKFRVKPKSGTPGEATFSLNPLGRWVMFAGDDSRQLEDGMSIEIGDTKFLYKYAARLPVTQEEKTPYLQIVGGLDDGRHILLDGGSRIIGSHPSAHAIVRGAGVAPRHAVARLQGTVCEIADLDSTTSLKAHGQSVLVTKLEPNDEVQLGSVRLVFKVPTR
jgi:hypothetical protein